jgi:hypothetical protein
MAGRMRGIALLASALLAGMASLGASAQVMGAHYPTGAYMSKAQFEALGCPGSKKHKG